MDTQNGQVFPVEAQQLDVLGGVLDYCVLRRLQKGFGGVTNSLDRVSVRAWEKFGAGFYEVGDHLRAGCGVVQ